MKFSSCFFWRKWNVPNKTHGSARSLSASVTNYYYYSLKIFCRWKNPSHRRLHRSFKAHGLCKQILTGKNSPISLFEVTHRVLSTWSYYPTLQNIILSTDMQEKLRLADRTCEVQVQNPQTSCVFFCANTYSPQKGVCTPVFNIAPGDGCWLNFSSLLIVGLLNKKCQRTEINPILRRFKNVLFISPGNTLPLPTTWWKETLSNLKATNTESRYLTFSLCQQPLVNRRILHQTQHSHSSQDPTGFLQGRNCAFKIRSYKQN